MIVRAGRRILALLRAPFRAIARGRAIRRDRRARGICVTCGEAPATPGLDECYECRLDLQW